MGKNEDSKDVTRIEHHKGHVVLPYSEEDFNEFLKGLLGKPHTVKKEFDGNFEVRLEDLVSLFHLVDQRINQQNEATLIDFSVTVSYSDGSSVTLSGLDSLTTYNEIKPVVSDAVVLVWKYLVIFQDKKVHEKQEIQVAFNAHSPQYSNVRRVKWSPAVIRLWTAVGIELTILHTARSWGADIESLLTKYITNLLTIPSRVMLFLHKREGLIGLAVAVLVALSGFVVVYWQTWEFANANSKMLQQFIERNASLEETVRLIADIIASGAWGQHFFHVLTFLTILVVVSIFLGTWVGSGIPTKLNYVLLTKKSFELKEKNRRRNRNKWWKYAISIIVSILCSVIGNWIFLVVKS